MRTALARWKEIARSAAVVASGGAALIVYNLRVHGVPIFTAGHTLSDLDAAFFPGNLLAYGSALLIIWPLMAAAPFFLPTGRVDPGAGPTGRVTGAGPAGRVDPGAGRPPLRNYALAVIVPITTALLFYYFHDSYPSFWVTLVIAPRLLQIALPVWIVAYATVLHRVWSRLFATDRAAAARIIAAAALVAMIAGTVVIDREHQQHLNRLKSIKDEVSARVPAGSTIIANWSLDALFGVMDETGYGAFTWLATDEPLPDSATDRDNLYLVLSSKHGYDPPPPELLAGYRQRFKLDTVPTENDELQILRLSSRR